MSLFILAFFGPNMEYDTILSCGRCWCVKYKATIGLPYGNCFEISCIAAVTSLRHHISSTAQYHISNVYLCSLLKGRIHNVKIEDLFQ